MLGVILIILVGVVVLLWMSEAAGNVGAESEKTTSSNNVCVNEAIVSALVSFAKVGLAVVSESYDYAYLNIIFQRNNICIMFKSDGVELLDSFVASARNRGESEEYDKHLIGKGFTCSVTEYKRWKYESEVDSRGTMSDINIVIQTGQNNKYYERVKEELKKIYPSDVITKIDFKEPSTNQYGSVNFSHSKY